MSGTITLGGKTLASHSNDTDTVTLNNVEMSSSVGIGYTTILRNTFTISTGTNYDLNFSTIIHDDLNWFDSVNYPKRITVNRNGIYLVTVSCYDIDCANRALLNLNHYNSLSVFQQQVSHDVSNATIDDFTVSSIFKCNTNDYFSCAAFHTHGSDTGWDITFAVTLLRTL